MCGILGILGNTDNNIITNGLIALQNRGYDSCGIVKMENDLFYIKKYVSNDTNAIDILIKTINYLPKSPITLAHTRWATHGKKSEKNCHPHTSYDGEWCLVHNGIIDNYIDLKETLLKKGVTFYSDTDTEVMVNIVAYYYSKDKNINNVWDKIVKNVRGSWGILMIQRSNPNTLIVVRSGMSLLVSSDGKGFYVSSEQSGFPISCQKYFIPDTNKLCILHLDGTMDYSGEIKYRNIDSSQNNISKLDYKYWTLKEINSQPDTVIDLLKTKLLNGDIILPELDKIRDKLLNIDNLILLGCGTSYFAGLLGINYFRKYSDLNLVLNIDASEFTLDQIPKLGTTGFILLSQSGETRDLYKCLEKISDYLTIGVINVRDSLISRETDATIYLECGKEIGVASTKSFTHQCLVLSMIAIYFQKCKGCIDNQYLRDLSVLSENIRETIKLCEIKIQEIVKLVNYDNIFLLGKGRSEAIAREGALKIKELSYIHAEGYSSSALKHGPFALLNPKMPTIIIAPYDQHWEGIQNTYREIESRHSPILFITNKKCQLPNTLTIKYNASFGDLLCIIPLQLLAYYLSIERGVNPDLPRNLAKSVVVD